MRGRRRLHALLRLSLLWLWLAGITPLQADTSVLVRVTAEPTSLTVGDRVTLVVAVTHPPEYQLQPLPAEVDWGDLELLEQEPPALSPAADQMVSTVQFVVTLWAPGEYQTPPLPLTLVDEEGNSLTVTADPLPLTVVSVLHEDDLELRDIRPQARLP